MNMNIKHYTIDTEILSTCCGAGVQHGMCMDCKEHNEGEEVAGQDQLAEALKETREKEKDLRADIAEAKRNLEELENDLEEAHATESELEQHLIS